MFQITDPGAFIQAWALGWLASGVLSLLVLWALELDRYRAEQAERREQSSVPLPERGRHAIRYRRKDSRL